MSYEQDVTDEEFEVDSSLLDRRMKHLNNMLNHLWKQWRQEYLLELRNAHRQAKTNPSATPIAVGDIVLVHDEGLPRGVWKIVRVEEVLTGRDGNIQGAVVRVSARNRTPILLKRPVKRLYSLEVKSSDLQVLVQRKSETAAH